jgi:hypothetical protein
MESLFYFPQVTEQHRNHPSAPHTFAFLPVNLAIDARVNLNDTAVPVITSIVWVVTSYFVSNSESFERVRARGARKQLYQFLLIGIGEFGKQIAKV